jgi:hypothetical protein
MNMGAPYLLVPSVNCIYEDIHPRLLEEALKEV